MAAHGLQVRGCSCDDALESRWAAHVVNLDGAVVRERIQQVACIVDHHLRNPRLLRGAIERQRRKANSLGDMVRLAALAGEPPILLLIVELVYVLGASIPKKDAPGLVGSCDGVYRDSPHRSRQPCAI